MGKSLQETNMVLGAQEPFQDLMERYQTQAKLQNLKFQFDGETLDLKKTPADYDMESGDLMDVLETQ